MPSSQLTAFTSAPWSTRLSTIDKSHKYSHASIKGVDPFALSIGSTYLPSPWTKYLIIYLLISCASSSFAYSASWQLKIKKCNIPVNASCANGVSRSSTINEMIANYLCFTATLKALVTCQNISSLSTASMKHFLKVAISPFSANSIIVLPMERNCKNMSVLYFSRFLHFCLFNIEIW